MSSYPPEEVPFQLSVNGKISTPESMIEGCGQDLEQWKHRGPAIITTVTDWFQLVSIGDQCNLPNARATLERLYGETPRGQFMDAFCRAYPEHDGRGPIGIAAPEWIGSGSGEHFPCKDEEGKPDLRWAYRPLPGGPPSGWRWIVPAKAPAAETAPAEAAA